MQFKKSFFSSVLIISLFVTPWAFAEETPQKTAPADTSPVRAQPQETVLPSINTASHNDASQSVLPKLSITYAPIPLKSRLLKKKFTGYKITVKNMGPGDVNILNADIKNGLSGEKAYRENKRKLIGITSVLGVSGFFTTALIHHIQNSAAETEGKPFNNGFKEGILPVNDARSTESMIPQGQTPVVFIKLKDATTGIQYAVLNTQPKATLTPHDTPITSIQQN